MLIIVDGLADVGRNLTLRITPQVALLVSISVNFHGNPFPPLPSPFLHSSPPLPSLTAFPSLLTGSGGITPHF